MLNSVPGIYRDGKIELLEVPPALAEQKVIVTFLNSTSVDLESRGIDQQQAAELRSRLMPFAEDWDRPEMDAYDVI
jgi:hypothetical protein